jgi:hypothetical protein
MWNITGKIIVGAFLLLLYPACDKENYSSGCLEGKVIDAFCADYIIQITGGEFDRSIADTTWTDPVSGNIYQNVFQVLNYCHLQEKNVSRGDKFYFRLSDMNSGNNCVTCLAIRLGPGPAAANRITITNCTPR